MKPYCMKIFIVFCAMILLGSGYAWAGGRSPYSHPSARSYYKGYHSKGGNEHHWPKRHYRHYYHRAPRYHHYRYYGPPPSYYHYNYYPGNWGRYDGAYYFSGAYSEPGFGFVFGTRGNW
jgi:hypothetical protein